MGRQLRRSVQDSVILFNKLSRLALPKIAIMRCCAITKNKWKRCSNQTRFVFCKQHRLGWWLSVVILIFVSVPSVFLDYKDLYNQFGPSDNSKMKPTQLK